MNITFDDENSLTVTREPDDRRPKNESHFYFMLAQVLNKDTSYLKASDRKQRYIKVGKRFMYCKETNRYEETYPIPGMNTVPYVLRQGRRSNPKQFIYDSNYCVWDTAKRFWDNGSIVLTVWNLTKEGEVRFI